MTKEYKTTANENKILNFLFQQYDIDKMEHEWISPTEIGHKVGGKKNNAFGVLTATYRHSTWASPICLRLVKKGLIKRNNKGWYRYYVHKPIPDDCGGK